MSLGDVGIIVGIVTGILGVFAGVIIIFINRRFEKSDKRTDARRQESVLIAKWMMYAGTAMKEMATAIKLGRSNGELAVAVADVVQCGQDLNEYFIEQTAEKNH